VCSTLTLPLSRAIQTTYTILHDRRVLHGDVEPRHIFFREDGTVSIIDFDRARQDAGEGELEEEARRVRQMFERRVRRMDGGIVT